MAVVKNLMTRAGFDASGRRKGVRPARPDLNDFKRSFPQTMRNITGAIATIGIGAAIRSATKDAMQFEASLQQIDRMMGESSASFNNWAKEQASAFGMARSEATRYGAIF